MVLLFAFGLLGDAVMRFRFAFIVCYIALCVTVSCGLLRCDANFGTFGVFRVWFGFIDLCFLAFGSVCGLLVWCVLRFIVCGW